MNQFTCQPLDIRFWSKIKIQHESQCWEWQGYKCRKGYGNLNHGGKQIGAHRISLFLTEGISLDLTNKGSGLTTDHICNNKGCVNPNHLQILTFRANVNKTGFASKTHCIHGHEFKDNHIVIKRIRGKNITFHRRCKICNSIRSKKNREGIKLKALLG